MLWASALAILFASGNSVRGDGGESPVAHYVAETTAGERLDFDTLTPAAAPLIVVVFLGTECPLVKQYLPALNEIADGQPDVRVLGVMSNWQDTDADVQAFERAQRPAFAIIKDADAKLADLLGATRTPEAFLLDAKRQVRYRGLIDDRFGVDFRRTLPRRRSLQEAIDAVRAGSDVALPAAPAAGCLIGRRPMATEAEAAVTWNGHVCRIVQRRCQECHRPDSVAPFSLLHYEDAVGWAAMIGEVVKQRRMPPWYADDSGLELANDCRLTEEESQLIQTWTAHGAPEGLGAPPPDLQFAAGWLHEPDEIIPMADQPTRVPATGPAFVTRFAIDPHWQEGKWIRGAECRPDNRVAVHHFAVFVVAPSADPQQHWARRYIDLLWGYSPGILDLNLPPGHAKYVPPGAQLLFELHYVPYGQAGSDLSRLGLRFATADEVTHLVRSRMIVNERPLKIPPFADDFPVGGELILPRESQLLAMSAHAHVRCTSFRFERLDRSAPLAETLLNIPRYDMFWQQMYELRQPETLPAGTVLRCEARYDNSSHNPRNPDPSITVYDGDENVFQNEMMNGFVFLAESKPENLPTIADAEDLFPLYKMLWLLTMDLAPLAAILAGVGGAAWIVYRWRRGVRRKVAVGAAL